MPPRRGPQDAPGTMSCLSIAFILLLWKVRYREFEMPVQGHTAGKGVTQKQGRGALLESQDCRGGGVLTGIFLSLSFLVSWLIFLYLLALVLVNYVHVIVP